jgi:hypothetical protein
MSGRHQLLQMGFVFMAVFGQMSLITMVETIKVLIPNFRISYQLRGPYKEGLPLNFIQQAMNRLLKDRLKRFK